WVNTSLGRPAGTDDLSGRDYVRHFAITRDAGLFIGEPVVSRGTKAWSINIARGIYGPSGAYLGVIVANLPLYTFANFYASIHLPNNTSVMLARRDGLVLVRHPDIARHDGV